MLYRKYYINFGRTLSSVAGSDYAISKLNNREFSVIALQEEKSSDEDSHNGDSGVATGTRRLVTSTSPRVDHCDSLD